MPKRLDIKKILVIGSGPIVIGQAAEFDYSGTQACQSLKEEGYEVVLINSNPATIMTDKTTADEIYMEPLTIDFVSQIIRKVKPDAILPTLGGQTGLNLAIELSKKGVLEECGVELLGTSLEAIAKAEDRELFKNLMEQINEPIPDSSIIHNLKQAQDFVLTNGYPVIVRPAFTLGGTGGGICNNEIELNEIVSNGIKLSPVGQCLLEKSIAGYKEIEYEVVRDSKDQAIVVCNMENVDPVGIHTGDSIVVAPVQTLSDRENQMLRNVSLKIIRELKIEGGCNVQLALDPHSFNYYVIEVNPRLSRSSALASKATGYPIAKIAAKIAVGLTLDEIINPVTNNSYACFEPSIDYVVTKIPRWPFDKFASANRQLGTQMKATGEVMAIGRTLEESLLKAIRSLELGCLHIELDELKALTSEQLFIKLNKADDERLFVISELIRKNISIQKINEITKIDLFFLYKIKKIIDMEKIIISNIKDIKTLYNAKRMGFSDYYLADKWKITEDQLYQLRKANNIIPVYKMVDTCAAEFESTTPYFYSSYEMENESIRTSKPKVIVLGSGPIRIGQGVEFDYATVHCVKAIKESGYEAIIINNNPETVSTDFSISDKLYFEPLTLEDVTNIIDLENPLGIVVQFGGQTAINLAAGLSKRGVEILGTSLEAIDQAENRNKFELALNNLNIAQPLGKTATNIEQALQIANQIGYPVLVRPSYVLGGRAMQIVYQDKDLLNYMKDAVKINPENPVLIDRYMLGKEIEVDAISDGNDVFIPGIMEHIERAGVHSGDSIAVYPTQTINKEHKEIIIDYTKKLAKGLDIIGLLNIQFVISKNQVYVIEVNPRASRTVPFLSKITNVPMANIATKVILGKTLKELGYDYDYTEKTNGVFVKMPVFSFAKLRSVDIALGPEMKSTGEAIGKDKTLEKALYKGFVASGIKVATHGTVIITVANKDKEEITNIAKRFNQLGFNLLATAGTAEIIEQKNIPVTRIGKIGDQKQSLIDIIRKGKAQFVINTISKSNNPEDLKRTNLDGFLIRRESVENGIACLTSLDTANAILDVLETIIFSTQAL